MHPQYTTSDITRFWSKVKQSANNTDCWEWQGTFDRKGYGHFETMHNYVHGHHIAHRLSWILTYGAIPDRLLVCHHCDNPKCVRPDHLFLGTPADNCHDMWQKGRAVPPPHSSQDGENNFAAKLTEQSVKEIRHLYKRRRVTQEQLAVKYGVARTTIGKIIRGERWSHII